MAVWLRKTLNIGMTHIPLRGMNDIQKKKLSIIGTSHVLKDERCPRSLKDERYPGDYLSQGVNTFGPFLVAAIVFSKWALRLPSAVT